MFKDDHSRKLFSEAQKYLPGGVDSPVRAFKAVAGSPLFIDHGKGSRIFDADGNEFIDYVGSWGPLIAGHAHSNVVSAVREAAARGTSFGAPTQSETELAMLICEAMPSVDMVRLVNSGTEAVMSAIRLARAATGRDRIVKFIGSYHGHSDGLLAQAGSGMATLGIPSSPGVPSSFTSLTLLARYNDAEALEKLFAESGPEIAAVIVEPVAANMGVVLPEPGFLEKLRELTRKSGALLIFDEVITGFRLAYGGAQARYGVMPDLTCLGKIIGGGLPVGAYGGRRELMEMVAPAGSVYQAGTLSGNPLSVTAGIETLRVLNAPGAYPQLEETTARLVEGIGNAAGKNKIPVRINRIASIFTIFFSKDPVTDFETASHADTARYSRFFHQMLSRGIYLPPSQFEAMFVSLAHTAEDIDKTVLAAEQAFAALGRPA